MRHKVLIITAKARKSIESAAYFDFKMALSGNHVCPKPV